MSGLVPTAWTNQISVGSSSQEREDESVAGSATDRYESTNLDLTVQCALFVVSFSRVLIFACLCI